jgi:3-oxoacyl-[acyl-carrier-protein] synthase II
MLEGQHIRTHARLETRDGRKVPRVISLAAEASDEALGHAGWSGQMEGVGVVACTSKGSILSWMLPAAPSTEFGLSDLSCAIARHLGSTMGPRLTLSAACASGLHGLIRGAMMIQSGEAKRVLVVAAEASVHPLFLASFKRLGVLPEDGEVCRPFDARRSGFLMSEAAAAVCLEAAESNRGIVAIDRHAMGGDATHLTGSDPDGRVLRALLKKVSDDRPADLFHAHGTGTITNDATELAAIEASFSADQRVSLFSHKGALGHSLGASGLVAVVLNCLAHQTGIIPGNINTTEPMLSKIITVQREETRRTIRRSLTHAAGFGGPMAVLSLVGL